MALAKSNYAKRKTLITIVMKPQDFISLLTDSLAQQIIQQPWTPPPLSTYKNIYNGDNGCLKAGKGYKKLAVPYVMKVELTLWYDCRVAGFG